MRVKMTLAAAALAVFVSALVAGPAAADVIKVSPGESIQAAIDSAGTYDTIKLAPGTYQGSVEIKKDGITVKGAGPDETVLEPSSPDPVCGGICVADADFSNPAGPTINNVIHDVKIKGLAVRHFPGTGVFFFGTADQRVTNVLAEDNTDYGIAAFSTTGGQYWRNVTPGNGEAGIYVGDSPEADAVVRDNISNGNIGNGIFVRDASHGVVRDNVATDNCIGILFLNTGAGNQDWTAEHNTANHNDQACAANDEGGDAVSGIGIAIASASRITLVGNTTNDNQPSGPTDASGGIVVVSLPGPGGLVVADENIVKFNRAFGNAPFDILWDTNGGANEFVGNRCATSSPDGLCVSDHQGGGHGGHGGHGHGDDHHGKHHGKQHGKHGKHHSKQDKHHKHHRHGD